MKHQTTQNQNHAARVMAACCARQARNARCAWCCRKTLLPSAAQHAVSCARGAWCAARGASKKKGEAGKVVVGWGREGCRRWACLARAQSVPPAGWGAATPAHRRGSVNTSQRTPRAGGGRVCAAMNGDQRSIVQRPEKREGECYKRYCI